MKQQPQDTRGRLDVLATSILGRIVEKSGNPVVQEMYRAYGDEVNGLIEKHLAPRDARGRIKRIIRREAVSG